MKPLQGIKRSHFKDYFDNDDEFDLIPGVRKLIEHYHENEVKLILASSATMVTINMVLKNSDWSNISVERLAAPI